MANTTLHAALVENRRALDQFIKGDPTAYQALFAEGDSVTFGNPVGPFSKGGQSVADHLATAAAHYTDGEIVDVSLVAKYVHDAVAIVVEMESVRVRVDRGDGLVPASLRVTSVFEDRNGDWHLVHRHADRLTPTPAR